MTSSGRPRTANAIPGYRQAHGVSGLRQTKGRRRFAWVAAVCGARAWCPSGSPNKSRGPVAVAVRPNGDPQLLRRSPVASTVLLDTDAHDEGNAEEIIENI